MNPTKVHDSLVEKGHERARCNAYATTTDRLRKQIRSILTVKFINAGNPVSKSEHMAQAEPEYIEACERSEKAEEEAGIASVNYTAAQAWIDLARSAESTRRAEMTLR